MVGLEQVILLLSGNNDRFPKCPVVRMNNEYDNESSRAPTALPLYISYILYKRFEMTNPLSPNPITV